MLTLAAHAYVLLMNIVSFEGSCIWLIWMIISPIYLGISAQSMTDPYKTCMLRDVFELFTEEMIKGMYSSGQNKVNIWLAYNERAMVTAFLFRVHLFHVY